MKRLLGWAIGTGLFFFAVTGNAAPAKLSNQSQTTLHDRGMNVRVNPLGLLVGTLSGDFDIKVSDRITIGPSLSYFSASMLFTKLTGFGIGARANIYLTGDAMTSSWILGPGIGFSAFSVDTGFEKGSSSGLYLGTVVGYQWVFGNGLNINLGAGANYYTQGSTVVADNGTQIDVPFFHGIAPSGEVTIGYAF